LLQKNVFVKNDLKVILEGKITYEGTVKSHKTKTEILITKNVCIYISVLIFQQVLNEVNLCFIHFLTQSLCKLKKEIKNTLTNYIRAMVKFLSYFLYIYNSRC
jgi:hypothetical protein